MRLSGIFHLEERGLVIPRFVILLYSLLSLILALTIMMSGIVLHNNWTLVYVVLYIAVALASFFFPEYAALIAAVAAFLSGWLKTTLGGYNVDIGIGLVSLAVSVALAKLLFRKKFPANIVSLGLLVLAGLVILSSGFTAARVISFQPIEGFDYQNYAYNPFGFPSDDVLQHVLMMTANLFSWFGIYLLALLLPWGERGKIRFAILAILLVNSGILIIQQFLDPAFLVPVGFPANKRLNGITSFCYALGAAAELLFVLAPIWFSTRKSGLAVSLVVTVLIGHAIILSGSRTAVFTAGIATLTWLILIMVRKIRENSSLQKVLPYILIITVIVGGSYVIYELHPADLNSAIGRIKTFTQQEGGIWNHFVKLRLRAYPLPLQVIANHPLTGVGVGSYYAEISKQHQFLMPDYQPAETYEIMSNSSNFFIGLAAELGIFAPAIFIAVIITTLLAFRPPPESSTRLTVLLLKASLLIYCFGLLLGPQIYNSEATLWFWILVAAIHGFSSTGKEAVPQKELKNRRKAVFYILSTVFLFFVVLAYFHFRTLNALDPFEGWKKLRYHLDVGFYPPEDSGRWSGRQAAMLLGKGNFAVIKWHTGEPSQPFEMQVRFGIEGEVVREVRAVNGNIYETVIPLPAQPVDKRLLTIQVEPQFIPSNPDDRRTLGIFVHSIEMLKAQQEGIGFWDWETIPGGQRFRWSKQVSYLPLSRNMGIIRFSIKSLLLPEEYPPVSVTASMDGRVLQIFELTEEWQEVELDLRKIIRPEPGIHLLRFEADHSYKPADIRLSDDNREIAFAITEIRTKGN